MLNRIIGFSLEHRGIVLTLWAAVAALGVVSAVHLPMDAFPDTTPVQIQVNTVAPALGPEEIETEITIPIELSLGGLPGLVEMRSVSKFGFSQVTTVFEDGTDILVARAQVRERIDSAELPRGSPKPELGPVATGLGEVFHYILRPRTPGAADEAALARVRTEHDWVVRPRLRRVEGSAEVNAWGGYERRYEVSVHPDRLRKYDLTLEEVSLALEANNRNVGGGNMTRAGELFVVRGLGRAASIEDLEAIVIRAAGGRPIRVRDVAHVAIGHEIRRGAVTSAGTDGEAVLGLGFMRIGQNSRVVTERFRESLAEAVNSLPSDIEVVQVYDRSDLVAKVLHTVRTNLFEAALLVIAILFVFLGNLRAGFLVALAIPLSLLFAANLMLRYGVAGSLMSLGALDFGLIVDSSVIQVENAVRRLGENQGRRGALEVVREAAIEVRKPTLFGELVIAIVYLPVLTLEGIEGKLFRPMALTVLFALAGSVALSLTLLPAATSLVLARARIREREPLVIRLLQAAFRPVLDFALAARWAVLVLAASAIALAAWVAGTRLGAEFVPRLSEGAIVINTIRLSSVSLEESVRYGRQLERTILAAFPDEVEHVWTRTGTAEVATDPMGLELSDVFITLKDREGWKRASDLASLVTAMRDELDDFPGMRMVFTQPIEMRVNEMIAGIRTDVGVKIFGHDHAVLKETAAKVEAVLEAVPGAEDVFTEQITGLPMLEVAVDREALSRHGIAAERVLEAVETLGGRVIGQVFEGSRRFDLAITLADEFREDPAAIGRVLVVSPKGERIPLSQLAAIRETEGPSQIQREWGERRLVVSANVSGRDVGGFVSEARRRIEAEVPLPEGTHIEWGGQFEHLERATKRLAIVVPISLAAILLLLYATYGTVKDTLRVAVGVPFAAVGGIVALHLRGLPFSVSAGVGFVALSGVSVLGDMVLVSQIKRRLADGLGLGAAIRAATVERLRPVLMTSLVAALGFLPMALSTGVGAEVQRPLATVVIGGLVSSTALTLLVLPVLYSLFGGTRAER